MLERERNLVKVVPDRVLWDLPVRTLALADEVRQVAPSAVLHQDVYDPAILVEDLTEKGGLE